MALISTATPWIRGVQKSGDMAEILMSVATRGSAGLAEVTLKKTFWDLDLPRRSAGLSEVATRRMILGWHLPHGSAGLAKVAIL